MNERISRRDWEQLSAFVDDQLPARECARLEARLRTDSNLRQALDDLRMTSSAVKSLPRLHAPRNFTLTSETAGQRQKGAPRLFDTFRLASAISSALLAIVLVGDLLAVDRVSLAPYQEMVAPAAERAVEATFEVEAVEEQAPSAMVLEAAPPEEIPPMAEESLEKEAGEGLADATEAEPETPEVVPAPMAAVRLAEILLGAIALVTGAAAYYFRRRGRS